MRRYTRYITSVLLLVFSMLYLYAKQNGFVSASENTARVSVSGYSVDTASNNLDYVHLLNSDVIKYSKRINPDAQILIGNVTFRHDSMYMYCDSALFFQNTNSFNAYHNVKIEQGDTLFLFGDSLFYDGNARMAKVRDNVRLENRDMVLLTDSLNYDRNQDLGYFLNGGTLLDEENTLTSDYGQYNTVLKLATFIGNVKLENTDYHISSDTLYYNTDEQLAFFTSPTTIISDENIIKTSNGHFRTDTKEAVLLDRSLLTQHDGLKNVVGDSLYYNDVSGLIKGYGDVIITNFQDKIDVSGDYVFFDRLKDSAVVTGNALAIEYSGGDSLFIHADTFRMCSFYNEQHDSVLYRKARAFNRVKAYRVDVQMIADSIEFDTRDSCLTLYNNPVIWSSDQQLLGEKIKIFMNDSTIEWVNVIDQTLFVQRIDSVHFNQISGREMKAFFKGGSIDHADVDGNVLVVYYPLDDDSIMIGMNTTEASFLSAYFMEKKINKIVIPGKSSGILYPMDKLERSKMYLSNFNWFNTLRPFNRWDVFNWRGKNASAMLRPTTRREVPLPTLTNKK